MGAKYRDFVQQHSQAKRGPRAVMNVLANYAPDHTGIAFASTATIAKDAGLSERTVQRHLQQLIKDGEIKYIDGGNGRGDVCGHKIICGTEGCQTEHEKGDKHDTDAEIKGDNLTEKGDSLDRKGDSLTEKGDKHVSRVYKDLEPKEPTREPERTFLSPPAKSEPRPEPNSVAATHRGAYGEFEAFDAMIAELRQAQPRGAPDHAGMLSLESALEDGEYLVFEIGMSDHRARDWIQQRYAKTMLRSLQSMFTQPVAIEFVLLEEMEIAA